jgi:hypothetical protein
MSNRTLTHIAEDLRGTLRDSDYNVSQILLADNGDPSLDLMIDGKYVRITLSIPKVPIDGDTSWEEPGSSLSGVDSPLERVIILGDAARRALENLEHDRLMAEEDQVFEEIERASLERFYKFMIREGEAAKVEKWGPNE